MVVTLLVVEPIIRGVCLAALFSALVDSGQPTLRLVLQTGLASVSGAGIGLTFRSGGTSLSGQAGTDGILLDTRMNFRGIQVLDGGARVRCQPGATVRAVNARLAPYQRALGPDPASEVACTIGGVVANNSSGMACGTVENSYRTLESIVAVLPSGTIIDTGAPDADEKLRALEPALYEGLLRLRQRVISNPASVATIAQQFSMKNTMGYGINSLVDYATPAEILTHLIVGSEGTLAFVASATFRTIPLRTFANSALLVFDDLYACLLYTSPSPRDGLLSRMPSSA